jgi:4-amino-4-deoxy-L-arabinose transferase-like glycosyltransferase
MRIAASFVFDLNLMESYGAVVARQFSLSYLDQPPIAWWLIRGATRLFHSESALAVRAPFLLLFIGSNWFLYDLTRRLFGLRPALYAAIAFNLSPLFGLWVGALALTDGPAVFFTLGALWCLCRVLFEDESSRARAWLLWIGTGLFFGCALASKYIGVLLLPGLLLFLLSAEGQRRWLARPEPYAAALVALLPLTPVLIWNAQHEWASFLFQGGRASPGGHAHVHLGYAARWIGMQAVYLQPVIFVALLIVLVRGLMRPSAQKMWVFSCLALVPLTFFPVVMAISDHALRGFHWGATGWTLLFPPLGAFISRLQRSRAFTFKAAAGAAVLTYIAAFVVLTTHAATGWIAAVANAVKPGLFDNKDPILVELFDWSDLPIQLKARGVNSERTFVTGIRWEACAKAGYAVAGAYPFLCLSETNIHFSYLADPRAFDGWDAVVVDLTADAGQMKAKLAGLFDSVEEDAPIRLTSFGRVLMPLRVYRARNFRGRFPAQVSGTR